MSSSSNWKFLAIVDCGRRPLGCQLRSSSSSVKDMVAVGCSEGLRPGRIKAGCCKEKRRGEEKLNRGD